MNDTALLQQKPWIDDFLAQAPRPLSSFSFTAMFAWCDFFDFELHRIDERLCIFARQEGGCFLYLPPLGGVLQSSTIQICFEHMAANSRPKGVHRIENIPENLLACFPARVYNQYVKPAEYVYNKTDVCDLAGHAYKSQRHDCNYFIKHNGQHTFRPYTDEDFKSCMALYECWAGQRATTSSDQVYKSMLEENRQVHWRLLKYWQPLGLVVRVLEVANNLVGYTFGYALDAQTFCIYAEIADLKVTGAAAYLFNRFCSDEQLQLFKWINTMDDFAMPNVGRAKQAWHPARRVSSYSISLRGRA